MTEVAEIVDPSNEVATIIDTHVQPFMAEIDRLHQVADDIEKEIRALADERRKIEENAGDALLDARFAGDEAAAKKIAKDLEGLRVRRTMLEQQLAACRLRVDKEYLKRWQKVVAVCLAEAAPRREQAAEHWKHTEELLQQINEYEKADFVLRLPEPKTGTPYRPGITLRLNRLAQAFEITANTARGHVQVMEAKIASARKRGAQARAGITDDDDYQE